MSIFWDSADVDGFCRGFLVPGSCVAAALVGVVLLEESVVVVMLFRLAVPVVLLPEVAGAVGGACVELEVAMVALGVGMVLGLDVGMGTVLPVIVTVK